MAEKKTTRTKRAKSDDINSVIRYAQGLEREIDRLHRIIGRMESERNQSRLSHIDRARLETY